MKKDVLRILTTSDALINPSLYTNPNLTSLFKQYTKASQKDEILGQINAIYAQDMPFVIVGYPYSFVNLKAEFIDSALGTTGFLYEYNWRNYLYDHVSLIRSKNLDFSKLLAVKDFVSYDRHRIDGSSNRVCGYLPGIPASLWKRPGSDLDVYGGRRAGTHGCALF